MKYGFGCIHIHDTLSTVIRCEPVFNELKTVNTQKQLANDISSTLLFLKKKCATLAIPKH